MLSSPPSQIIEHLVLFKVKSDADPSAVSTMLSKLNGLISLEPVVYVTAGPIVPSRPNTYTLTHVLHSRHLSREDLAAYATNPIHLGTISKYVLPITEDNFSVDWVAVDFSGPVAVSPDMVVRVMVLKLKEELGDGGKNEVLRVVRGIKDDLPSILQLTVGENFTPGRNKGFSICSIGVFKDVVSLLELEKLGTIAKIKDYIDDVLEFNYGV